MLSKEEMLRYLEGYFYSGEKPNGVKKAEDVLRGMANCGFKFSLEPRWDDNETGKRYYVVLFTRHDHVSHTTASTWADLEDAIIRAAYNIMWPTHENSK